MTKTNGRPPTVAEWPDTTLHDVIDVRQLTDYTEARNRALRLGPDYEGVDARVTVVADNGIEAPAGRITSVIFDAAYTPRGTVSPWVDGVFRTSLLVLACDQVVRRMLSVDTVYTASVTSGETISADGSAYRMHPALHLLIDGSVPMGDVMMMVSGLYDHMATYGYRVTGRPSNFLIDIDDALH